VKKENLKTKKKVTKITKRGKKNIEEFKKFISKGNIMDLAVGVIIGGAFGKIVTSLVNDILMPVIGALFGGLDFTTLSIKVVDSKIMYGNFIQNIVDFLIVSACIFVFIKILSKLTTKKEEEQKNDKVEKDETVKLLEEIRDLLKK
jgi:large conductance mechanosensitive channel protein